MHQARSRAGRRPLFAALAAAVIAFAQPAAAQDYPSKPIRIVIEYAAGAGGDVFLRVVTGQLSGIMGQPVVIENRAGAGGVVAAESVIRSAPDGYTLLGCTPNAIIVRPFLAKSNTINLSRDLTPVTALWITPSAMMVSSNLPVNSLKELIDYARANPGKVAYGTTGVGTHHHFNGEQLQILANVELRHIPYKANAQAFTDLVAGEIPMVIGILATAAPFLKSGKIKVLSIQEKRVPEFPNAPMTGEVLPGFVSAPSWTAIFGPARLPDPILRRLNGDLNKALATPEVKSRDGFELIGSSPEAFQKRIQGDIALVGKIVKAANIQQTE